MKELSGDVPLSFSEKIQYLAVNFFRGLYGRRFFRSIHWVPEKVVDFSQDSLFRIYSNEFVKTLLPTLFDNKKISILDIGCGSGYIRAQFKENGFTGAYEGIDIKKHKDFDTYNVDGFSHTISLVPVEQFKSSQKYNLIFSFTALEHVSDDMTAIKNVSQYLAPQGVQVHIIPSFWSLFIYLFHGYRQYTESRIKKIFSGNTYTIYSIGGTGSFLVQLLWVTFPERIFKSWPLTRSKNSYQKAKKWALQVDKLIPFFAMQYAVVVKNR